MSGDRADNHMEGRRMNLGATTTDLPLESAEPATPEPLLQLGLGFWASKTLLSAVELGLFTELARGPRDAEELRARLGLHPRGARDFFDALVSLRVLERDVEGLYANGADADLFLDRAKPSYVGGMLEMANARLYGFWGSLTAGLRSGDPQNEAAGGAEDFFAALYSDPERLRGFLHGMTGLSMGAAKAIAAKFPWDRFGSFADVGTAEGGLPVQLALAHERLTGVGFDLPPLEPIFADYVASFGLADRLRFQAGDFFADPLPQADVITMGHILHDWPLAQRKELLAKAQAALPDGGAVIVFDAVIDDERRHNSFGLLMSLNMLIETRGGSDYTGDDCRGWLREVGFRDTYVQHLAGPDSMVVGIK
jgi:O-methyltransferase/methyltransferase family protein